MQLISTTKAEWGVKQSASIAADSVFAQHLPVLAHAFQLAVGSLLLQQSIQQLPSLDGVPRLQHLGISAPAQQPSKPLPPSKAARLELTVVWQALVVFLTSLGTLAACCRRFTVGCAARQCQPASSFMLPLYLPQPHVPWPSGLPTRCSCRDGEPAVPLLSSSAVPCAGGCPVLRRHIGPH